mgnify:FL=1
MFDDQKQKVIHQVTVPDNTFSIFCNYDEDTKTISLYVGDFTSDELAGSPAHEMLLEIGDSITMMLEATIQNAVSQSTGDGKVELKPIEKVKNIDGNIIYANFSKRIH